MGRLWVCFPAWSVRRTLRESCQPGLKDGEGAHFHAGGVGDYRLNSEWKARRGGECEAMWRRRRTTRPRPRVPRRRRRRYQPLKTSKQRHTDKFPLLGIAVRASAWRLGGPDPGGKRGDEQMNRKTRLPPIGQASPRTRLQYFRRRRSHQPHLLQIFERRSC